MADNIILLLVEDEPLILHTLEDVLTDAGFEVVTAIAGTEAIVALDNQDHRLAGLITDIRLGDGINGWDVARHAREIAPSFAVVYMSGDSVADWPSHGVPNSAIIQKPFATAQLITAISHLLNEVAKGVTE